jgi:hypothetical protein
LKSAARAFGNKEVSVNLHHLRLRQTGALVQVVDVLGNQQKFIRIFRQFDDCFMSGIWLRIANALPPLAIPFPNQLRIALERFRCRQLYRIQIAPVAIFATKCWNPAFSRNTRSCYNEDAHQIRSANDADFQVGRCEI